MLYFLLLQDKMARQKEMFTWDRNHEQEMEQYIEDFVNTEAVTIE